MSEVQATIYRTKLGINDLLAFLIPCLMCFEVRVIGRIFLPEIILLSWLGLRVLETAQSSKLECKHVKKIIMLGGFWLLAQIFTDIVRGSTYHDFLRGWSNISFFLFEFLAIYLLAGKSKRRLLLFAFGISLGQILTYFINPNIFAENGEDWKFGVGYALTLLMVLSTQFKSVWRIKFLSSFILLAVAVLNFSMGARSLGGICFISALYTFVYEKNSTNYLISEKFNYKSYISLLLISIVGGVLALNLYGTLASAGLLGESAEKKYEIQSQGEFGLLLGGRQELIVSTLAIIDSPVIGHGSWAKDEKYSNLLPEILESYGYDKSQAIIYEDELAGLIPTHSFLFGAWVNSGIFGAIFWLYILLICQKMLLIMYKIKYTLVPIIAFTAVNLIWNIFFSPLGAENRVYTAYSIVLLLFMMNQIIYKYNNFGGRILKN